MRVTKATLTSLVAFSEFDCGCPGCRAGLDPWTAEHFETWAAEVILDTGELWRVPAYFLAYVADLYARAPADPSLPLFPEDWLVVPEGNAKTTSLGGLGLHHVEHTLAAMVPWAAASREQAEIGYRQAEGMVLRTRRLQSVFKPQEGYRRIKCLRDGGRLQVFAADDRTGDGIIPGRLAILDELHRQRNLRLYRTWRGKLLKRHAQIATISTAGEPGGEFEETRERIRQTADVVTREGSFTRAAGGGVVLHEWAVAEDGDVEDMEVVKAANPFDGITVEALREKRDSPTMTLEHWRRFVCNLPTRSGHAAIAESEWAAAETAVRVPAGEPVDLGLDVGWKWDTTALVPLWAGPDFRLLCDAVVLEPPRDGTMLDSELVRRALVEVDAANPIQTVVMDMSRAEELAAWIEAELGATVIDRGTGNAAAAEDYENFTKGLRDGSLKHTGSRDLKRHVLNAIARTLPQGDARFDRPSSTRQGGDQDRRVIDALVAAAMVVTVSEAPAAAEPFAEVW